MCLMYYLRGWKQLIDRVVVFTGSKRDFEQYLADSLPENETTIQEDEREFIQNTDIHEWFIKNAERYDNIRILKGKMENAIFEKLTEKFIISK